jgi:hypothetical protein
MLNYVPRWWPSWTGNKITYWGNKIICCGNKIIYWGNDMICCGNTVFSIAGYSRLHRPAKILFQPTFIFQSWSGKLTSFSQLVYWSQLKSCVAFHVALMLQSSECFNRRVFKRILNRNNFVSCFHCELKKKMTDTGRQSSLTSFFFGKRKEMTATEKTNLN